MHQCLSIQERIEVLSSERTQDGHGASATATLNDSIIFGTRTGIVDTSGVPPLGPSASISLSRSERRDLKQLAHETSELTMSLDEVNSTVVALDKVYTSHAAEAMRQKQLRSATNIARVVRGRLARKRVQKGLRALRSWRRRNAYTFLKDYTALAKRYQQIEEEIQQWETSRRIRLMYVV